MKNFCATWLPLIILILTVITPFILYACGYDIYIINGEKYPWIVNSEKIMELDSLSNSSLELLNQLEQDGLVLSPQEFSNHTYNFYSWLLTILVAVIGIVVLVFGLNIDRKIQNGINENLKAKWMELMRTDKEVDSTIGGIIDDKLTSGISNISHDIEDVKKRVTELENNTTFDTGDL